MRHQGESRGPRRTHYEADASDPRPLRQHAQHIRRHWEHETTWVNGAADSTRDSTARSTAALYGPGYWREAYRVDGSTGSRGIHALDETDHSLPGRTPARLCGNAADRTDGRRVGAPEVR